MANSSSPIERSRSPSDLGCPFVSSGTRAQQVSAHLGVSRRIKILCARKSVDVGSLPPPQHLLKNSDRKELRLLLHNRYQPNTFGEIFERLLCCTVFSAHIESIKRRVRQIFIVSLHIRNSTK